VDYEGDSDNLIMTIYLLFSICCMRLLHLGIPDPVYENSAYEEALDDSWGARFR
jgi:hypothetical protein